MNSKPPRLHGQGVEWTTLWESDTCFAAGRVRSLGLNARVMVTHRLLRDHPDSESVVRALLLRAMNAAMDELILASGSAG